MSHEHIPDVWKLLFDQTPIALRWALGIMSAGVFTLATHIYQRNQRKAQAMEDYIDKKIEHIMQRLDIIDGRILTVLNTLASTRR